MAATLSLACASAPVTSDEGVTGEPLVEARRLPVDVRNQSWLDVNVFGVLGSHEIRLGVVTALSSATLELPPFLATPTMELRFRLDPIGSDEEFVSEPVHIALAERFEVWIAPRLAQSSVSVW